MNPARPIPVYLQRKHAEAERLRGIVMARFAERAEELRPVLPADAHAALVALIEAGNPAPVADWLRAAHRDGMIASARGAA